MFKSIAALTALLSGGAAATLPVDKVMEEYEAAIPEIRTALDAANKEINELGPVDLSWSDQGLAVASAIATGDGTPQTHVLGEWEIGGHSAKVSGDLPFDIPGPMQRYSIIPHEGSSDYHSYYRLHSLTDHIVLHFRGTVTKIGNAECHQTTGIDVLSSTAWEQWSDEIRLSAFSAIRGTRDDQNTYCYVYHPLDDGRFIQTAFSQEGRPYIFINSDPRAFAVTSREEAHWRVFGTIPSLLSDDLK